MEEGEPVRVWKKMDMNGVERFREFMCERGARPLRLSMWGSRSEWLTEGERQQTVVEHKEAEEKKKEEKGKGSVFEKSCWKVVKF